MRAEEDEDKKEKRNKADKTEENENKTGFCLRKGERLDDLQRNQLKLIQNPSKFCFGMDAVLLSGYAAVKRGGRCLDLGSGNGIIPILLSAKTEGAEFVGLEIQEESADMARRSIEGNGLTGRVRIETGDIREASRIFGMASFDVVTSNPPYMTGGHGLKSEDMARMIARHELLCSLSDLTREASRVLKPGGKFFLVHRPFRLAEIIRELSAWQLEPQRMRLVYPYVDKEPNMVLIEAVKGGRARMTVERPLIVYQEPGVYTREIYETYGY